MIPLTEGEKSIDSVVKTNSWTYETEKLNREIMIGNFYEKDLLLSKLPMSYYPEPDIHIRDKVKIVLDLSNYTTRKELDSAADVDTSNVAAKKDFIPLKDEP